MGCFTIVQTDRVVGVLFPSEHDIEAQVRLPLEMMRGLALAALLCGVLLAAGRAPGIAASGPETATSAPSHWLHLPLVLRRHAATVAPTSTPTTTATATRTETSTLTQTAIATPSATDTPIPTETATQTGTATATPAPTATGTPSATYTKVPTATATRTPSPTVTSTASVTSTRTWTTTATSTETATPTATPSATSTPTLTPTATTAACEPWVQVNADAFGLGDPSGDDPPYDGEEAFEVTVFKGQLYVGMEADNLYGARVWRTKAGVTVAQDQADWEQVVDDAFGNPRNDHIDSLQGFQGQLYASTANWVWWDRRTEVWRSDGGDKGTWELTNNRGFSGQNTNFRDMVVFSTGSQMWLCGGTRNEDTGAQVWCTTDGRNWIKKNENGFGTATNLMIHSTGVSGGYLYIGVQQYDDDFPEERLPGSVWRTHGEADPAHPDRWLWEEVINGEIANPTDAIPTRIDVVGVFEGHIYLSLYGGNGVEIWRSASGDAGSWHQVNEDGFGDPDNWAVLVDGGAVYNGGLYVATWNKRSGVEVWRTCKGTSWEQVNRDGFGDAHTTQAQLVAFNGYLYAWATNYESGQKVMRTRCGN